MMTDYRNRITALEYVSSKDLTPHPGNWRNHGKAQTDALKGVLSEVGIAGALLAYRSERNGGKLTVIDGHLRKDAAPQTWPVLVLDVSDAEADYLLATHDPLAAMATADAAALDALLSSVNSGEAAVQAMLAELAKEAGLYGEPVGDDPGPQIDKAEELRQKWGTESGQLWQLGEHRVICGDCTDGATVGRVMGGERAQLLFTSPPYAQQRSYTDEARKSLADWDALMRDAFYVAPCSDDCQVLVNLGLVHHNGEWLPYWDDWIEWMRQQGWRRFGWYVWDKLAGMPGDWNGRFSPAHEWVFHFNKQSKQPEKTIETINAGKKVYARTRQKNGDLRIHSGYGDPVQEFKIPDSVIRCGAMKGHDISHPAVMAVAVPAVIVSAFGGLVYDPFIGSGTTLIACERLGRQCRGVEIAPAYVAVTLERWATMTGKTPELLP